MYKSTGIISALLLFSLSGCEGFWGKKTDSSFIDEPQYNARQVAYVPIQPALTGFSNPTDIIGGYDELLYVADSGAQQIIAFDQAGARLGAFSVPGVTTISQDRNLDLLALGTKDTSINGTTFKLPAIYRINQIQSNGGLSLTNAKITHTSIHPFCFNPSATPTITDEQVQFTGIAHLADGRYYVSKRGNGAAGNVQGDQVVLFNQNDVFISPILVSTPVGTFSDYFRKPTGITGFAQPPQSPAVNKKGDFIFTSIDANQVLKVQGISLSESDNGASYQVKEYTAGDTSKASSFLYTPFRFTAPSDVTIAGDQTGYIFVVDAAKDSLFQFNGVGYEGVNPPAGATSRKAIYSSFGGRGTGLTQFNRPRAVAYQRKIVYVADAGNGRVLRFKLTTDFQ